MKKESNFSIEDFKDWMEGQYHKDEQNSRKHVGKWVESKINRKKLLEKISKETGEIEDIVLEFKKDGGVIVDVDGKDFTIEVDSGTFVIPRNYVKRKEEED